MNTQDKILKEQEPVKQILSKKKNLLAINPPGQPTQREEKTFSSAWDSLPTPADISGCLRSTSCCMAEFACLFCSFSPLQSLDFHDYSMCLVTHNLWLLLFFAGMAKPRVCWIHFSSCENGHLMEGIMGISIQVWLLKWKMHKYRQLFGGCTSFESNMVPL